MDLRTAKELLHIEGWLARAEDITARGKDAYLADDLLQAAGDSLMMKLGEAANRLSRIGVLAPEGVTWASVIANRNFLIHQYDEIDREISWVTLALDLLAMKRSLAGLFDEANALVSDEHVAAARSGPLPRLTLSPSSAAPAERARAADRQGRAERDDNQRRDDADRARDAGAQCAAEERARTGEGELPGQRCQARCDDEDERANPGPGRHRAPEGDEVDERQRVDRGDPDEADEGADG